MKQCKKCPWRIDVDPRDIPGYDENKHIALGENTIACDLSFTAGSTNVMACHESTEYNEKPCVGYLANQLGPGNNIGLRLWAMRNLKGEKLDLIGKQHRCFKDTLTQ